MGASQANGLGSAEAPEPHSRLRPSDAIPSAVTGEAHIGDRIHRLTHWGGDITDPAVRADLNKDIRRAIRGAAFNVLLERYKRPKASDLAEEISREAADAVVDQLWRGYCLD